MPRKKKISLPIVVHQYTRMEETTNIVPESNDLQQDVIDLRPRPINYTAPPIFIPIPTQVCFFLGDRDKPRNAQSMRLVEVTKIVRTDNQAEARTSHKIYFTVLDTEEGHPTANHFYIAKSYSTELGHPLEETPPDFVAAIDRWATAPDPRPAYADVLDVFEHGFGLLNAKYLDLKLEMAGLNATMARLVAGMAQNNEPNQWQQQSTRFDAIKKIANAHDYIQ